MFNWAAELGTETNDRRFPVIRLKKWVHLKFVHGMRPVPPFLSGSCCSSNDPSLGQDPGDCQARPRNLCAVQNRCTRYVRFGMA